MNNNRCIMCNDIIAEGRQVCHNCENNATERKSPKHPCQNCVYFPVCGEHTRTEPCEGRQTKTDVKKANR